MILSLLACFSVPKPDQDSQAGLYEGPTELDWVESGCDPDEDIWTFNVRTLGWTSGGMVSLSADQRVVEAHDIHSAAAAADRSWDDLQLELAIVADPRDATPGSSSAWLCDEQTLDEMAYRVVVYDPSTGDKADCAVWGAEVDWNALAGYSACDPL